MYFPFRRKSSRKWSRTTTAGMIQPIFFFYFRERERERERERGRERGRERERERERKQVRGKRARASARERSKERRDSKKGSLTPSASPDPAIDWNATPTHSPRPLNTGPPEFPDCFVVVDIFDGLVFVVVFVVVVVVETYGKSSGFNENLDLGKQTWKTKKKRRRKKTLSAKRTAVDRRVDLHRQQLRPRPGVHVARRLAPRNHAARHRERVPSQREAAHAHRLL